MSLVNYDEQKTFWEGTATRRSPDHPVVRAFVGAKLDFLRNHLSGDTDSPAKMLEVGCGNGYFSVALDAEYDLTCLDFSPNMLEMHPLPESQKVVGNAEALEFGDNSFDLVFCGNLLHHLEDPSVAVREMRRVARHNVILIEPNTINPLMFLFILIKKEERGALKFTAGYLRALGVDCGMTLKAQCTQGAIVPNKTPAFALPLVRLIDWRSPLGFYHIAIFEV